MSSSLCRVAIATVTPAMLTGSSTAYGFMAPVRPTFRPTWSSVVSAVVGGNLNATAQRGSRPTAPSRRCCSNDDTLTTAPSTSNPSSARRRSHSWQTASASSGSSWRRTSGLTGKRCSRSHASASQCEASASPSLCPIAYAHSESGRRAVTAGSFWRSEPAAELRGFMNGLLPAAICSSFTRAKPSSGRYTSPRTSTTSGSAPASAGRLSGIARIVRRLAVTSSPTTPFPRVAPRTKTPRS